ncbi:MAG: histidinol-phosphatase [Spirochaetota bacterium]
MENYHTHTARCKHAVGSVHDYVNAAINAGIGILGISDHTPLPDGRWQDVRMHMNELADYCAEIHAARRDGITVLTALECEDFPGYRGFYRDVLVPRVDYLIGGNHYFRMNGAMRGIYDDNILGAAELSAYAQHVIAAIGSGLYAFIAHPDLFGYAYHRWDAETQAVSRDICSAAKSFGVPLEINGYGMRKRPVPSADGERAPYPWEPFWEIAGSIGAPVVINSDAHRPEDVAAGIPEGYAIAERYGLRMHAFYTANDAPRTTR